MLMIDSTTEYMIRKVQDHMREIERRLSLTIDGLEGCDNDWESEKREQSEAILEDVRNARYYIHESLDRFSNII